jgi:hypothetical protein
MGGKVRIALVLAALVALALPAAAGADHRAVTEYKSVKSYCKHLRAELGQRKFKRAFGGKKKFALRRCVSRRGVPVSVRTRSVAPAPTTLDPCQPEPPLPVRAFALTPTAVVCTPLVPAPVAQPPPGGDDEEGDEEDGDDDDDGDDDEDDDGGDDDDESDHESSKHDSRDRD